MASNNNNRENSGKKSLVGELASSSTYDEVFLNCTAGYCIFDSEQNLQAFSSDFPNLYPSIIDQIAVGMSYTDYMRVFYKHTAVQNMGQAENETAWLDAALSIFKQKSAQHIHHLHDGRWMQIDMSKTSTGHWLFLAMDITELRRNQIALEENHQRYRSFAHLSMDWFWELDKNLCYVYHSGHQLSLTGVDHNELVGVSRIESVAELVVHGDAIDEHNNALLAHEPFDVVLTWRANEQGERHVNVIGQPTFDKSGRFTGYLGCGREVTKEIKLQSRLNHLAQHDDLTGLVNRRAFEAALSDILVQATKEMTKATLCFIDLDQFKLVNDGGGHDAGDQLLKNIAQTFCSLLGNEALVARLGGDEFGVILYSEVNQSLRKINRLIRHISSTPFDWKERKYSIGASAGLVAIDENSSDISVLMSHADTACYIAKNAGRNQAQVYMYDEFFQDPISLELKQVNLLRQAMDNDELMLYLQPIRPLQFDRTHMHFEVLLRLNDQGQIKSAGEFIPVAEKYDLMQHLDKWVLNEALETLSSMQNSGLDVSFSINLSGNTLSNKDCLQQYHETIVASNISPKCLVFEVTETSAIKNIKTAQRFIKQLKTLGCKFSLDDFGSGLSSFGYLKEMSVDYLKIDGSFVRSMRTDATCRAIVSAFNQLSHELGMETVAEFVEDRETANLLKELGIDYAQGYGVGAPQHTEQWVDFLLKNQQAS